MVRYYKVTEVAQMLGVTPRAVGNLIKSQRLSAIRVGMGGQRFHYRVTAQALEQFNETRSTAPRQSTTPEAAAHE